MRVFFSDEALTTAGDSETCEIWFDISKCGLMPEVTTDKVIYKIGLSTYQDPDAVLVLKVTCLMIGLNFMSDPSTIYSTNV